jgi:hypothetical protein
MALASLPRRIVAVVVAPLSSAPVVSVFTLTPFTIPVMCELADAANQATDVHAGATPVPRPAA